MVSPETRGGFCCLVCKFFNRPDPGAQFGECRRNAPMGSDTYGNALWPIVPTTDWCGQGATS